MDKICIRGRGFLESSRKLRNPMTMFRRQFAKDEKEGKEKDKELDVEEQYKVRKGVLHDKQQSLQEESYFHKEEVEQLKGLKKKLAHEKDEPKNEDKKN